MATIQVIFQSRNRETVIVAREEARPLVSVVIPLYNMGRYVGATLESVRCSDYWPIELIVVDDGSTDDGGATAQTFLHNFGGRTKYLSQENCGEAFAVNRGVAETTGDFVIILSADDLIAPKLISKSVSFFASNPNVGVLYPDWAVIDESGNVVETKKVPDFSKALLLGELMCLPGPGTAVRGSLVREILPFRDPDFPLISDFETWLRLSLVTEFGHLPKVLAYWRDHSRGTTAQYSKSGEWSKQMLAILDKFFSRGGLSSEELRYKRKAYATAWLSAAVRTRGIAKILPLFRSVFYSPEPVVRAVVRRTFRSQPTI